MMGLVYENLHGEYSPYYRDKVEVEGYDIESDGKNV